MPLPFLWNHINVQILHTSPSPSSPDANTLFQLSWSLAWVGSQPPSSVPPPTLQSDLPETKFNDVTPCSKLFSGTLGLLGKSSSTHWPLPNAASWSHLTFPTGLYASAMLATYVSLYLPYYSHLHVFVQLHLSSFSYAYLSSLWWDGPSGLFWWDGPSLPWCPTGPYDNSNSAKDSCCPINSLSSLTHCSLPKNRAASYLFLYL